MTQLESARKINALKVRAIKNGGYERYREKIIQACAEHKRLFGKSKNFNDLTPKQFKSGNLSGVEKTSDLEVFKLPDGSTVKLNRRYLKSAAEEGIKLYNRLLKEPGWEVGAAEELAFWKFMLRQANRKPGVDHGLKKTSINSKPISKMATKKAAGKPATKKKKTSVKKACRSLIRQEGVKADGTLKKGYKYKKGGGVVKVKAKPAAKKKVAAKKPAKRKPAAKKK